MELLKKWQDIQESLKEAQDGFDSCETVFQAPLLRQLKRDLVLELDQISMSMKRKDYFLHQLNNCHDWSSLEELIQVINLSQLKSPEPQKLELIWPSFSGVKPRWVRSFPA